MLTRISNMLQPGSTYIPTRVHTTLLKKLFIEKHAYNPLPIRMPGIFLLVTKTCMIKILEPNVKPARTICADIALCSLPTSSAIRTGNWTKIPGITAPIINLNKK